MRQHILLLNSICFLVLSCASQKEVIVENSGGSPSSCSGSYERDQTDMMETRSEIPYKPYFKVKLSQVIKDSDTLHISELTCLDSTLFTEAFNDINVREMCIEMGIQGNTYFSAKTNKYGGFEEVKVERSVDICFKDLEEKIKQKVLSMRIIPEDAGTYEIVFYHYFRLD